MERIRVAVCDDEPQELDQVSALIRRYGKKQPIELTPFNRASELLERQNEFDVVFLDIEMEPPTGYEIAERLAALERKPTVIFITKSSAYTIRGYGVALRYLPKPVEWCALEEAMGAAIQEQKAQRLTFTVGDSTYSLHLQTILFMEAYGHSITIHTTDGDYCTRGTLKELYCQLPQRYFAQPDQSYIVSLHAVKSLSGNRVYLTNGYQITASRRKLPDFRQRFYEYLGR